MRKFRIEPYWDKGNCRKCGVNFIKKVEYGAPNLCRIDDEIYCISCGDKVIDSIPKYFLWWSVSNHQLARIQLSILAFLWGLLLSLFPLGVYVYYRENPLIGVIGLGIIFLFLFNTCWFPLTYERRPSDRIGFSKYISNSALGESLE